MSPAATHAPDRLAAPPDLSNRPSFGALATVLRITIARQMRGKRIWLFILMFAAPLAIALLVRRYDQPYDPAESERALIFGLIPQAILPLAALLFASSLVQDDVEEQTLTYFLIRPIPKWTIYLIKVLGATLVTSALAAVFTAATLAAVRGALPEEAPEALLKEAGVLAGLSALALMAYISIFGLLGLFTRRVLVIGVGYILVFEGVVSNIPFLVRYGTILFHTRVLAVRWLGLDGGFASIDVDEAPAAATSLAALLGATALFLVFGAWLFSKREFRVKTPEGS
jgi:ABC-2 type transport system permease protein